MKKKIAVVLVALVLLGVGFAGGYNYGKERGFRDGQRVMGFDIKYPGPNCPKECGQYISTGYRAWGIDNGLHYIITNVPQK